MKAFSQQYFDFAWQYLNHIPTNKEYNTLIEKLELAISLLQFGSPLTSEQTNILFNYSKFSGFSWGNNKSTPLSEELWDNGRIVEQDFNTPAPRPIYLEFPNPDNPQGILYPPITQKETIPQEHIYTPTECKELQLFEKEINNNIFSGDGVKQLFKYRQQNGFSFYLD
jgi:hypothetical protein